MAGLPKHIPFLKSPLSSRVGQTVRFTLVSRGDDVQAVGISLESDVETRQKREMAKTTAGASDLITSSTLGTSVEKTRLLDIGDVMSSVPAQSHSRCFLRRMNQFRNSDEAKQVQLVIEAERSLDNLLGQSTLDGDAICRLARKCASWLRPPVLQSANPQWQSHDKSKRATEDQVHLQERIRKILIEALNHLDLQDPSTLEAMKAALFYVASLCQRLNEKYSSSSATVAKTPARMQWLELNSLLVDSLVLDELNDQYKDKPAPRPSATNTQDQIKERADAVRIAAPEGEHKPIRRCGITDYYEPTSKIKAITTVSQGKPVELMCSECPFTMTSSWYLQHPKTLKRSVIAPRDGHDPCQQKLKKRCYWKNPDGYPVIKAFSSDLRYCPHNNLLRNCVSCGGDKICIHSKQRHQCKECKHLPAKRRGPKRYCFRMSTGERPKESMATAIS